MDMKLLFDVFDREDLSQKWAIAQIADFEYEECFMQPLLDFFSPDDCHLIYTMDQDLRMMEHYPPKHPHIIELQKDED